MTANFKHRSSHNIPDEAWFTKLDYCSKIKEERSRMLRTVSIYRSTSDQSTLANFDLMDSDSEGSVGRSCVDEFHRTRNVSIDMGKIFNLGDEDDLLDRMNPAKYIKTKTFDPLYESKGGDEEHGKTMSKIEEEKKVSDSAHEATRYCPSSYRNDDFFADSPYFDAFMCKEMHTMEVVTETMDEIAKKMEGFSQSGFQMAAATRRLASSCKFGSDELKSKHKSLEPELVDGLEHLGDVLDEMASAQEHLCKFFNSFIVSQIQSIAARDSKIKHMRNEARKETDESESSFKKYVLAGENSWGKLESNYGSVVCDGSSGSDVKHSSLISLEAVSCGRLRPEGEQRMRPGQDEVNSENHHQLVTKATLVRQWKHDLVKIRTLQTSAELKRYQLGTHIVHSKYQQNVGISKCLVQMVSEMNTYFSHCSNLVTGLMHCATKTKAKCEEFQLNHENRHWGEHETALKNTLHLARQMEMDAQMQVKNISETPQSTINPSSCNFDIIEESNQIWDLPATLAFHSGHTRRKAKGVLAEGWLYQQKRCSHYRKNAPWHRNWFIIRNDGVYTLQANGEDTSCIKNKNIYDDFNESSVERIKVCDLQLCTVRDMKDDPSVRFGFELITPTNYSERLMLQARGPYELKMWLDAIRLGISCQLAAGCNKPRSQSHDSPVRKQVSFVQRFSWNSMSSSTLKSSPLPSSEIRSTIIERGRSLFLADEQVPEDVTETNDLTPEVKELMKENSTCADCGEGSPDWVSLNLGILICLECSGVHRSLGVHISKVRSLTLDALSDGESRLLLSLGNACVNQFWEKEVPRNFKGRSTDRDKWIRRKYIEKEFIGTDHVFGRSEEKMCRYLYDASKSADVIGVMKAIIYGGKVEWENTSEDNKTALEVCGVNLENEEDGNLIECKELLLNNGAELKPVETE